MWGKCFPVILNPPGCLQCKLALVNKHLASWPELVPPSCDGHAVYLYPDFCVFSTSTSNPHCHYHHFLSFLSEEVGKVGHENQNSFLKITVVEGP